MSKVVYLFRHGETDWNKNADTLKYCEEVHNVYLNENGRQQAEELVEVLKDKGIEHIYTSKLKRANETGKILANAININFEIVNGLEEIIDCIFSIEDNNNLLKEYNIQKNSLTITANSNNKVGSIKIIAKNDALYLEKEIKIVSLWM